MTTDHKHFAFISRHIPTPEQVVLADKRGIALHSVGDLDAFTATPADVKALVSKADLPEGYEDFDGVIVVHPAAALRLLPSYTVGVFENANRAPAGEKPTFEAVALHLFS